MKDKSAEKILTTEQKTPKVNTRGRYARYKARKNRTSGGIRFTVMGV